MEQKLNSIIESVSTWLTGGFIDGDSSKGEAPGHTFHCIIKAKGLYEDDPVQELQLSFDIPEGMDTHEEELAWAENQFLQAIVDGVNNQAYKQEEN